METKAIRKAVQAGRFYPARADDLRQTVARLLAGAQRATLPGPVMGLIAPHAGYEFSGQCAAWAYRQIESAPYRRVVVLAPSHYAAFTGAALFGGAAFETPLGVVPLDGPVTAALRERKEIVESPPAAEREEHSLEAQLPFLQVALDGFALIPLLVSDFSDRSCEAVAGALVQALNHAGARVGGDTVIVASSDLYHGSSLEACERSDAEFERELARRDPAAFLRRCRSREIMACGAGPIAIMMRVCNELGARALTVLHRTNSNKVYPVHSGYVVGYLAAAMTGEGK